MTRRAGARIRGLMVALVTSIALATGAGAALVVGGQATLEPSDVVLVFDVSDSILESDTDTNVEFADALEGIADRVDDVAADLATGNATVSFVVFGRTAIPYAAKCAGLKLHEDPAAIAGFEACLRDIAGEYRSGTNASIRSRIDTTSTDHVAALVAAEKLLPSTSSRAAVIFFTDGEHDPPGTARDNENVVARVAPAFEGRTPLAILPVGLGAGAGAFESKLAALYTAYFRDMAPCAGRGSFAWPEVVFPSADAAGTAVALALQEVTCSFTVAPTAPPSQPPTAPPVVFGEPLGVRVLASNESLTIQWLPPTEGAEAVTDYLVRCTPTSGGTGLESEEGVSTALETEIKGLVPGTSYTCVVAATDGITIGPASEPSQPVAVLGIPNAPSQPRVQVLDSAAQLTVDAATGGLVDQYVYECTDSTGVPVRASGSAPTVLVGGLTNGVTYQCVAYAESSVGRSPASPASASFSPCAGFLDCNPWSKFALIGLALAAILAGAWFAAQRYKRRSRVWITAQIDGGENRPLGWGPELGIRLEEDERGWFAAPLPSVGAAVHVKYAGQNAFVVTAGTRVVHVHQGDAAPIRDEAGGGHTIILRRYRDRPDPRKTARAATEAPDTSAVQARIPGARDDAAGGPESPSPD